MKGTMMTNDAEDARLYRWLIQHVFLEENGSWLIEAEQNNADDRNDFEVDILSKMNEESKP
jgi:hypothetical protein